MTASELARVQQQIESHELSNVVKYENLSIIELYEILIETISERLY